MKKALIAIILAATVSNSYADVYEELGLEPDATTEEVIAAVRAKEVLPESTGAWITHDTTDPITDARQVYAFTVTVDQTIYQRQMIVRCQEGGVGITFSFDDYLGDDRRPVQYRVDSNHVLQGIWPIDTEGTTLFVRGRNIFKKSGYAVEGLLKEVVNGSKLVVRTEDFRGTQITTTFSLVGAKEAITPVLRACGVSL